MAEEGALGRSCTWVMRFDQGGYAGLGITAAPPGTSRHTGSQWKKGWLVYASRGIDSATGLFVYA